jgi:hypothetical protein
MAKVAGTEFLWYAATSPARPIAAAPTATAFEALCSTPGFRQRTDLRIQDQRRPPMSVAKVTEISSTSSKSFQDAIETGLSRAGKTLDNITGAWIKEQKVEVKGGKITGYRVNMKVTFVLKD